MTPDLPGLLGFAFTSLVVELTPGPNMGYLALIAATEGRRAGFAAVAGVACGLAALGVAAGLGLSAVISESAAAYQGIRWAGVIFLIWLAWDAWRGGREENGFAGQGASLERYFRRGLITNLLNPKAALFFIAVLPGFLTPGAGPADVAVLSAIYVAVATAVHAGLVAAAGAAQGWLADEARAAMVRRGMALALLGVAAWVIWKT